MRHALLLALTVFFSACLTVAPAQAQYASAADSEMINVDFPGGTLGAYIEAIEAACESTINFVVVDDKVLAAPIAKIRLRGVTPNTALELVQGTKVVIGNREYLVDLDRMGGADGEAATIRVTALDRGNAPRETVTHTMIFAGQPLIEAGLAPEHLLAALEIALDLSASGEPAEIRFHEETGLIFANGSNDQINAIHSLMGTLRGSLETNIAEPVEDLEEELEEAHAIIEELSAELEEAHAFINELEVEHAAFAAQMQAAEMQMEQFEETAHRRIVEVEEAAQMRLQDLEERAQMRLQMERERAEQQAEHLEQQAQAAVEVEQTRFALEVENANRRAQAEIEKRDRLIEELESLIHELRAEHEELMEYIEELESDLDDEEAEHDV
ncbi:MAG: hypothetical protein ACF8NJ_03185 [Phycisphaerales bacterium JB038]